MSNSVLVFEENKAIQGLIASTISDQVELWQENRPEVFLQLAERHRPGLIFISNVDQQQDYAICRRLLQHNALQQVPRILLVNARDEINEALLEQLGLQGMIRKPFEAATLQEHIQRYLPMVELQDAPVEPVEEVNVFDDEMLGLIQEKPEAAEESSETEWSGSATGAPLDEPSPPPSNEPSDDLLDMSDAAPAPKEMRPPEVEDESIPEVDFSAEMEGEGLEEEQEVEEAEASNSPEEEIIDMEEDEEIQSLDELLGAEAAMEGPPGLLHHEEGALNSEDSLRLADLEGEITNSTQNDDPEERTMAATEPEALPESEEAEGPIANLELDLDAVEDSEPDEELTETEGEESLVLDDGFEIPPLELDEEEETLSKSVEETTDNLNEIPPLAAAEPTEDELLDVEDDWAAGEFADLESETAEETTALPEDSNALAEDIEDDFTLFDEIDEDDWESAEEPLLAEDNTVMEDEPVPESSVVAAVPAAPAAAISPAPTAPAYRGPQITSSQGILMEDVGLDRNDFDVEFDIWSRVPDMNQKLRADVVPIVLDENDFEPFLPERLASVEAIQGPMRTRYTPNVEEMDYYLVATTLEDEELAQLQSYNDSLLLTEQGGLNQENGLAAVLNDIEATAALAIGSEVEGEEFHLSLDDDDSLFADDQVLDTIEEEEAQAELPEAEEHTEIAETEEMPVVAEEATQAQEPTPPTTTRPKRRRHVFEQDLEELQSPLVSPEPAVFAEEPPTNEASAPLVEEEEPPQEQDDSDYDDVLDAESVLSELEGLDQEMADLEQHEVELMTLDEDPPTALDDEVPEDLLAEAAALEEEEPEELEEETFDDWDEAVGALEEEKEEEIAASLDANEEPEELEEETFDDWDEAVGALEEEKEEEIAASLDANEEPEELEEETFDDWDEAVGALEEEKEEEIAASLDANEEPEELEEETFDDWDEAVGALEEASEPTETPAAKPVADANIGSLDAMIESMIARSVQKAVADAMPQIVERIVQELRQPHS